jgi:hypothetical protein
MHSRTMSRPAGGAGISILAGVLFLVLGLAGAHAQVDDPILINEVLADPSSDWDGDGAIDFKGDEWIEILNNSTDPVNLSDYFLRDGLGDDPHLQLSGVLDPGGTAVFYGSEAVAWQTDMGMTTSGFSLNNGGDLVQLVREFTGPDGPDWELIFAISYDDHEAEDDRSCGFNTELSDWLLFDAINPYGGDLEPVGSGCAPSPGEPNTCQDQVGVETHSFGQMKLIYR